MCHGHFACDCHTDLTRTACPSCGAEGGIELYLDGCSECLCRTYEDGVALLTELAGTACARTFAECDARVPARMRCAFCDRWEDTELVDLVEVIAGPGIPVCHTCLMGQHDAADVAFELWVEAVEAEAPDAQPWSLAWEPPANDVTFDAA